MPVERAYSNRGESVAGMKRGLLFTVDAAYALVLVLLLTNLYIMATGQDLLRQGTEGQEQALLARDKAITGFYLGLSPQGEKGAANYACYSVVENTAQGLRVKPSCEDWP